MSTDKTSAKAPLNVLNLSNRTAVRLDLKGDNRSRTTRDREAVGAAGSGDKSTPIGCRTNGSVKRQTGIKNGPRVRLAKSQTQVLFWNFTLLWTPLSICRREGELHGCSAAKVSQPSLHYQTYIYVMSRMESTAAAPVAAT